MNEQTPIKPVIKVNEDGKKLLLEMLDNLVRANGSKMANFAVTFPQLLEMIVEDAKELPGENPDSIPPELEIVK